MNVHAAPNESSTAGENRAESHALLHEMLRSFTTLARTLNLSHAVSELNSTRQTVRRHISALEDSMGSALFQIVDRQYVLTAEGANAIPGAMDILARGNAWIAGQWRDVDGLVRLSNQEPSGLFLHQQQMSMHQVFDGKSQLMREALLAWTQAGGHIESPALAEVRPYLLVYRDTPSGWICVEMGEKSFYSLWYGWTQARSAIGRSLSEFPGGGDFELLLKMSFREIQATRGARLDQIVSAIPREPGGPPIPAAYQRMLLGGRFPDGSFAMIAVVDRADSIVVEGLDQSILERMPADAVISM